MYEVLLAMSTKTLHDMAKLITTRGYAVLKSSLTPQQTQHLRQDLTVSPKVNERYAKGVQNFTLYLESSQRFYVPRQWGLKHLGEPEDNIVSEGIDLPTVVEFTGTPYDYQQEIVDTFIEEGACGLICVPCGRGKTFMALCAAVQIGKRFLIVVDKEFLMNQWKGEIERYIKGARVGILQGPKCEVEPAKYDITICMLQTVCQRDYPAGFFDGYGFTIFDECHHLGAQHFSRVMTKIQTQWCLGLSATPHRDDGLNKVFEYFLGPPVYQETTREPDATVQVEAVWYRDSDPSYAEEPVDWKGEVVTARLLTQVVNCKKRTESIITRLLALAADKRRKILVLSERRAHLEALHDAPALKEFTRGYYVGGMKQEVLDKNAETCQILFATYAMASEAMNIKALNAMIMASPRKKVEQSTGRILRIRPEHRQVDPLIIDIIDQHKTYESRWYQRLKYYRKCKYTIKHIDKPKTTMEDEAKLDATLAQECVIKINA
jgi:superfamily II DNA or RNA helicase